LFSNRYDRYWVYDIKENKLLPVHEVFAIDYSLPEFSKRLVAILKAFDGRLEEVSVVVQKMQDSFKIIISAIASYKEDKVIIPEAEFFI